MENTVFIHFNMKRIKIENVLYLEKKFAWLLPGTLLCIEINFPH